MRALLLGILLLPLSASADYARATVPMTLERVSEHVYYVRGTPGVATDNEGFVSNAGFVVTGLGVVVFDALGTPSLARKFVELIRSVTGQPIVCVVVSHYHADHTYGLQVFEDMGVEIIAPYGAQTYLASDAARERLEKRRLSLDPWVDRQTRLVLPDRELEKSWDFRLGEVEFTVNFAGKAHSDGDQALFLRPAKVLFSEDIIFRKRIPFVGNADSGTWLETLQRMETGGLNTLVPGHGPTSTHPGQTIRLTRRYLACLRKTMGAAVEDFQPFDEAYAETDWSEFENLPAFKEGNRINAYQVYLLWSRNCCRSRRDPTALPVSGDAKPAYAPWRSL